MITKSHYFGTRSYPPAHGDNAEKLLSAVNALLHDAAESGIYDYWIDPGTETQITDIQAGCGNGGYSGATESVKNRSHHDGTGIDIYDPENKLDAWITRDRLVKYGLYREVAPFTDKWCHLQTTEPKSGNRSFIP